MQSLGYIWGDIRFFLIDPLFFCKTKSVARMNHGKSYGEGNSECIQAFGQQV